MWRSAIALSCLLAVALPAPARSGEAGRTGPATAKEIEELRRKLDKLQKEQEEARRRLDELGGKKPRSGDLEALRKAAEKEAGPDKSASGAKPGEKVFKSGALGLQALNPEISVTGDMLTWHRRQDRVRRRWDSMFRGVGIHIESYLDPYTHFKAAIPINEAGAELGEAYMTRFGLLPGLSMTAGKFRQQFGVINRWHKHALDQVDFPVPLRAIFGEGGLNQTGFSLDWAMPALGGASQALTFQVTDGSNGRLFDGNTFGTPVALLHYKYYRDLSENLYAEVGVTGLVGWNDEWETAPGGVPVTVRENHPTGVFGVDLCFLWEPAGRMRYRNIEWRSEAYVLARELEAPDGSGEDTVSSWGFYTYLQGKVTRTLDVGIRYDYYRPDSKGYAAVPDLELSPLAVVDDDEYQWQMSPYVTWHQSPFVKYRLQWDHSEGFMDEEPQNRIWFQIVIALGPHKHDRY